MDDKLIINLVQVKEKLDVNYIVLNAVKHCNMLI